MLYTFTLIVALAALVLAGFAARQHALFRAEARERMQRLEEQQEALNGKIDVMADDWSRAYAAVSSDWAKHIERVEDTVSTRLAFQRTKPKQRR